MALHTIRIHSWTTIAQWSRQRHLDSSFWNHGPKSFKMIFGHHFFSWIDVDSVSTLLSLLLGIIFNNCKYCQILKKWQVKIYPKFSTRENIEIKKISKYKDEVWRLYYQVWRLYFQLTETPELVCYAPWTIVRMTLASHNLKENLGKPLCFVNLPLIGYFFFSKLCTIAYWPQLLGS
mgnify:CR=1 FL=1